jgi:ketosteroid isomerase-like protein
VSTQITKTVLDHHFNSALRGDLEAVLMDYAPDAVLLLPEGPRRGISQIKEFFIAFLNNPPAGIPKAFQKLREDVEGDIAYVVWKAEPGVSLATDTLIIRNGKIIVQTFAAQFASEIK